MTKQTKSKYAKQVDPKDKGKPKATSEYESETESDYELTNFNMSDEDEGEPLDQAYWEENFMSEKAFRAFEKILNSKKYIPKKPINFGTLKKNYPDFLKSLRDVQQ